LTKSIGWQSTGNGKATHLEKVIEPPSADQLKIIRDVVSASVGVNTNRGDQITVETLPFQATLKAEPPKPDVPTTPTGKPSQLPLPKPMLIGIGAGLLLLVGAGAFFLVSKQKKAHVKALAMEQRLAAAQAQTQAITGEPQTNGEPGATPLDEAVERHRKLAESTGDYKLPPMLTSKTEVLTKQLTEEAQKDPVALAQIVRSWLNDERKS
jgi:flagellar biosynthesis/type III secretory pathway M-ring protein FliF/YscJ